MYVGTSRAVQIDFYYRCVQFEFNDVSIIIKRFSVETVYHLIHHLVICLFYITVIYFTFIIKIVGWNHFFFKLIFIISFFVIAFNYYNNVYFYTIFYQNFNNTFLEIPQNGKNILIIVEVDNILK